MDMGLFWFLEFCEILWNFKKLSIKYKEVFYKKKGIYKKIFCIFIFLNQIKKNFFHRKKKS